jgi:two-component system cell cycle sensor histidine kinase/response regulator CckA
VALQRAHHELETRVEERTAELAAANMLLSEEVAERRQAEETLQQRNLELALLSAAVDQTADGVVITDPEGIIVYVNVAFERISGYARTEVVGQPPNLLRSGRQDDAFYHRLCEAITTGQTWHGRLLNGKKDGTLYPVDATITPVRNQGGEVVNYVATMRDVSVEVSLEERVRHAQKMEALGRLAGGIAHDFNNLVTVIELGTRLMERRMRLDDPMWADVQRIRETTQRATDLTRRLLHFSRREPSQSKVLQLSRLAEDLSWMLRRIIGSDIQLVTRLAEDLWPVEVDPTQMEQVIMNLVVNARDAMPMGGTLTIETANVVLDGADATGHLDTGSGSYVQLTVTDTGLGMSDEVKAHIFEPFYSTKKRGEGTGLGLATVFGIVKQAGGHIRVRSQPGAGTSFEIYLPRTDKAEEQPEEALTAAIHSEGRATETILVVEDDPLVLDLTVRLLASRGYRVQAANNGQEALEMSERDDNDIHLLLTDLILPKIGGWELSERLQKQRPDMQVLYMSGYGDDTSVARRVLDADRPLLTKPFDVEALADKVRAVLDGNS